MESLSTLQIWLYDNLPVCVALLDRDLVYRYTNQAYAATQGMTVPNLTGRTLQAGWSGWNAYITHLANCARDTGRPVDEYNVSLVYPHQPELQRVWDITMLPIFLNDSLDGFALYMVDVTSRQEAAQLSVSEGRLRSVLEAALDPIVVMDQEGTIVETNPAMSRVFGYDRDEMLGKSLTIIMPEALRNDHLRGLRHYLHTDVPHMLGTVYETYGLRSDGKEFPCELSVAESYESPKRRYFVGIIRDITERKRLQDEVEMAHARLTTIFNTVPLPLYVVDLAGRVTFYNDAALKFYGGSMANGVFFQMTRLYPATRQRWPVEEWPIMRALHEGTAFENVEQIVVFPDGREVPVLANAAPVIFEGKTIASVGISQDLTLLKAADRAKDAFLALITHELRTPLAAIISWTDLALEDATLCEEALRVIQRSANSQRHIIDDLLDISRVLYGKMRLEKEPVDAWEIARHAAENLHVMIEGKQLTLILHAPEKPLHVFADPVRLEQVIVNLLGNAVKFTPAGGSITLEGARDGATARLRVIDTGIGIPPTILPFIFQRFEQVGRERTSGGLGLGLAVVKSLVELHGGRVTAESAGEGHGSMFTVWLPLRDNGSA